MTKATAFHGAVFCCGKYHGAGRSGSFFLENVLCGAVRFTTLEMPRCGAFFSDMSRCGAVRFFTVVRRPPYRANRKGSWPPARSSRGFARLNARTFGFLRKQERLRRCTIPYSSRCDRFRHVATLKNILSGLRLLRRHKLSWRTIVYH